MVQGSKSCASSAQGKHGTNKENGKNTNYDGLRKKKKKLLEKLDSVYYYLSAVADKVHCAH